MRFVSQIVQDLRDGKNIILCLPEHLPDGLASTVRDDLGEGWDWRRLYLKDEDRAEPVHLLFSEFVRQISPDTIRNTRTLSQHEDFAGKIIWLEGMTKSIWPAWKKFLTDYEQPCRSIPQLVRTVFCVPLVGELALQPPAEELCLSLHHWHGIVDRLDMLLLTASLFQEKPLRDLQKQVAISVVANLALWDYELSESLASEKLEKILSPVAIFQEFARERGWCPAHGKPLSCSWHGGMRDFIDGQEKIHSAALIFNDSGLKEIARRIWSAQVGVMLPFVEERRQDILERLKGVLKVPFQTDFGVISDWQDLEIGHIEYQISNNGIVVNSNIIRLVRRLKEIRNSLSHLEPISSELLLCHEISNWHCTLRER